MRYFLALSLLVLAGCATCRGGYTRVYVPIVIPTPWVFIGAWIPAGPVEFTPCCNECLADPLHCKCTPSCPCWALHPRASNVRVVVTGSAPTPVEMQHVEGPPVLHIVPKNDADEK